MGYKLYQMDIKMYLILLKLKLFRINSNVDLHCDYITSFIKERNSDKIKNILIVIK